jgi:hypothetical protein
MNRRLWSVSGRELRGQLWVLVAVIWVLAAVNTLTPGPRYRSGQLKGADFLHFYVLGTIGAEARPDLLFDASAQHARQERLVAASKDTWFVPIYGPQTALLFAPLAGLTYLPAASCWALLTASAYGACIWLTWKRLPSLKTDLGTVLLAAAAFPPFFSLIQHGQTSIVPLVCVVIALLAFREDRNWIAGFALGSVVFKPQYGIAIAVVMIARGEWRVIGGALAAIALQWGGPALLWGTGPLAAYLEMLKRGPELASLLEPKLHQLHSLRAFWMLLLGSSALTSVLAALTSAMVLIQAVRTWRPDVPLEARFSVLLLATVLVAPHAGLYDLVLLAPAFLLTAEVAAGAGEPHRRALRVLMYAGFASLLVGPVAAITRLQLSVPVLWAWLWCLARMPFQAAGLSDGDAAMVSSTR